MVDDSAVGQGDERRRQVMIEEEEERVEVCRVEEWECDYKKEGQVSETEVGEEREALMMIVVEETGEPPRRRDEGEWFAYKKVAKKVQPIATDLPEQYRIVHCPHPNPLEGMPELPVCLPVFRPGE